MKKILAPIHVIAIVSVWPGVIAAQHDDHHPVTKTGDQTGHPEPARADVLGLPMARNGSGTAWLPDDSPMRGAHYKISGWDLMFHGQLFVGYNYQATEAGDARTVSQNWLMGMARHPLGGGLFEARSMLSLEPLTVGDEGYALLLQTGETNNGVPVVDAQHAHDLFMELAGRYDRAIGGGIALQLYAALAGEPALGPVAFPHRPSAMSDPMAPLGHHWLDSTHISFGVLTAGIFTRTAKLEGSWFNGREPDENRWDLDLRAPDSYAARLSVNPASEWSLQGSYAFFDSPNVLEPDVSAHRVTSSATHAAELGNGHSWTSTAAIGVNVPDQGPTTPALLAEAALDLGSKGATFVRAEYLVKTGHDFDFPEVMENIELPIAALSVGHVHPIAEVAGAETALGVRGSVAYAPAELEARYGTRTLVGVMAYVQVQPTLMH